MSDTLLHVCGGRRSSTSLGRHDIGCWRMYLSVYSTLAAWHAFLVRLLGREAVVTIENQGAQFVELLWMCPKNTLWGIRWILAQ